MSKFHTEIPAGAVPGVLVARTDGEPSNSYAGVKDAARIRYQINRTESLETFYGLLENVLY
jgi:hypothetical protein